MDGIKCVYLACESNSKDFEKPEMKDVFFVCFPQPEQGWKMEKCQRWIWLCGREAQSGMCEKSVKINSKPLAVHQITTDYYICSKVMMLFYKYTCLSHLNMPSVDNVFVYYLQ